MNKKISLLMVGLIISSLLLVGCDDKVLGNEAEDTQTNSIEKNIDKSNDDSSKIDDTENNNNDEDSIGGITIEKDALIDDKVAISEYIYEHYKESIYGAKSATELLYNLELFYLDIDKDGLKDVMVYTPIKGPLSQIPVLTAKGNKLDILPSELDDFEYSIYVTKISNNNEFIEVNMKGTGSGSAHEYTSLYVYNGKEIVYTGASIEIKGHEAHPDYQVEIVGETIMSEELGYKEFTHITHTEGTESKALIEHFVYDPLSFSYTIEQFEE